MHLDPLLNVRKDINIIMIRKKKSQQHLIFWETKTWNAAYPHKNVHSKGIKLILLIQEIMASYQQQQIRTNNLTTSSPTQQTSDRPTMKTRKHPLRHDNFNNIYLAAISNKIGFEEQK